MKTEPTISIQDEVAKIHAQYGTTEMANYRIEKLLEKYIEQSSPKIKQLDWEFHGIYYSAQTAFGAYILEENEENENMCDLYFGNLLLYSNIPVNKAKHIAQQNLEKKMKQHLM